MASVHANPGSSFWTASVRVWIAMAEHPAGGFWRRSRRSTRIPLERPKRVAQAVADEMERTANAARSMPDARQFYEQSLLRIMAAAGIATGKTSTWHTFSAQWLSEQRGSPNTLAKYRGALARFGTHLGGRASEPLRAVAHSDLTAFCSGLEESGLSPATVRQLFKIVRWVFQRAHLLGLLERNPAALVKLGGESAFRRKPFSPAEVRQIFRHIDRHELAEWRVACLFGLLYGLRLRDAIRRRADEIESEGGMKILRFVPMKKRRKGDPIALPLVGELAAWETGEGFLTPALATMSNPSKVFSRILRDAGVKTTVTKGRGAGRNQSDKSFHSWRHTTNTMLLNAGVDVRIRQLISDHESRKTNAIYTHPAISDMAAAVRSIASVVPGGGGG